MRPQRDGTTRHPQPPCRESRYDASADNADQNHKQAQTGIKGRLARSVDTAGEVKMDDDIERGKGGENDDEKAIAPGVAQDDAGEYQNRQCGPEDRKSVV